MKIKKRLLSLALSGVMVLGLLPGMSMTALADTTVSTYTLQIPSTLNVSAPGWNATSGLTAAVSSGDTFDSGKKLTVTATSANRWALKSGDNTVGYNLATADGTYSSTATPASWEFTAAELNASGGMAKTMGIIVDDYSTKPAGTYTDTVTFTAKVETAASGNPAPTTATIDAYTGGAFAWSGSETTATGFVTINTFAASDGISILSAKNANTAFTTSAGGAEADFTGTATDDAKFYAVYPYTAGLTLSGITITGIVIPTNQWNDELGLEDYTFTEHSAWDPKAPIAYATTTGTSLQFHNLCAILKVDFPDCGDVFKLTIDANEPLAGTFSLNTSTGALTPTAGSKSVTVTGGPDPWDPQITCLGARHVYVAIAPGTYTSFHVVAELGGFGFKDGKRKASATFEAGKIYSMGEFYPNPGTSDQ